MTTIMAMVVMPMALHRALSTNTMSRGGHCDDEGNDLEDDVPEFSHGFFTAFYFRFDKGRCIAVVSCREACHP